MDENQNQSDAESLSAQLRETRQVLEELRNYQGAQIQLASSSQVNLKEQLEAITSTTEQANQMLLNSLQRLEDSGNRQNEASRKVILSGYKAFEESVERTANRNETQLRKMQDEQNDSNERQMSALRQSNANAQKQYDDLNRKYTALAGSVAKQVEEGARALRNRFSLYAIRNYLLATIPTSIITSGFFYTLLHFFH
ncbi:hypothetical protein [Bifidobacterium fermentum]|uniref:Mobilization protein MobB n=2 Tax=Bifidobacterium TaxID=1678 RepID=A0A261G0E0_9BIFI|nr:Mobilization protein MobB [Bifidobacterium aquikefiri]